MIGDQIKKYRIRKGLTQEELGNLVNVTTQAVSRWERGGVPDAELLSKIADALDVSIDMLFGRKNKKSIEDMILEEIMSLSREEGFKRAFSFFWMIALGLSKVGSVKDSLGNSVLDKLYDENGKHYYNRMCLDEGIINARMDIDSRYFFFSEEPRGGYREMLNNTDEMAETFALLSDKDILKILYFLYSRKNIPIFLSLIAAKTGLETHKTEKLMERLCDARLAYSVQIETETGTVKAYTYSNETSVIPILCHAKEIRDQNVLHFGSLYERKKPLF